MVFELADSKSDLNTDPAPLAPEVDPLPSVVDDLAMKSLRLSSISIDVELAILNLTSQNFSREPSLEFPGAKSSDNGDESKVFFKFF